METLSEKDDKYIRGWSWGAFFNPWIFCFVNKQNKMAWKIILFIFLGILLKYIPIFATYYQYWGQLFGLLFLIIAIWLGIRGRERVWKSEVYLTVEQFQKKQLLVTKLNIIYIIITIFLSFYFVVSFAGKYVANVEQNALVGARKDNPSINEVEFSQGFKKGKLDGSADLTQSFATDKSLSYQEGQKYGYVVACIDLHHDKVLCYNRALGK